MSSLVIDYKFFPRFFFFEVFRGFFICLRSLRKKTQECSISGFPNSAVICSQKFHGLMEMVESPFWYKKYKYINFLKASSNCSMWVVYWRLLNQFSRSLLNILVMLGLHHRCLPENFRKIFQNTGRLLLTFKILSFDFQKRKIIVT